WRPRKFHLFYYFPWWSFFFFLKIDLVVFILISLPIISGEYCIPNGPCEDAKKCNIHCLLLGFKDGGQCVSLRTTFCCCITSKTSPMSSLPEHYF
ncbi:unnamed protein product, partial [Brassica rapa subsp. trilocularis]